MTWLAGNRVYVTKATAFTNPGPGTLTGIDRSRDLPFHVTLDNEEEPFDLIAVREDEITALSSPSSDLTNEGDHHAGDR